VLRVWRRLLGLCDRTVLEDVEFDEDTDTVVAHVRPKSKWRRRCGRCGRRSPGYDGGEGRRRWRGLDLGTVKVALEADAPRVRCRTHGVTVAAVPWARHGAGHTREFDDTVAWLALQCSKTAVTVLARIAWRTVGSIVARVGAEIDARVDRLDGLARIGIDEISYKRGHRYLTVVVDHDSGRLVWAAPGRDKATVRAFFDQLGAARSAQITHVSADQADWIAAVVAERCPQAVLCADPFHIVAWATEALDHVRRDAWNQARGAVDRRTAGRATGTARLLKHARYALWKNPENLTLRQREKLAWVAKTDPRLHRAYLLN
jgi:transposase